MFAVGCSLFVACCLLVVFCLLFKVCFPLFNSVDCVHCVSVVVCSRVWFVCRLSLFVCCWCCCCVLVLVSWLLFLEPCLRCYFSLPVMVRCLLLVACLLFVIRCLLLVVYCLLLFVVSRCCLVLKCWLFVVCGLLRLAVNGSFVVVCCCCLVGPLVLLVARCVCFVSDVGCLSLFAIDLDCT